MDHTAGLLFLLKLRRTVHGIRGTIRYLSNFEEVFRVLNSNVPLIIYAPGIVKSGEIAKVTSQIDLAPTILDLLGYSTPDYFIGQSMFRPGNGSMLHKFMMGIFNHCLYLGFEPASKKFTRAFDMKRREWLDLSQIKNQENIPAALEMFFLSKEIIKKSYFHSSP